MIDWILVGIGLALSNGADTAADGTRTDATQGGGAPVQAFAAEP